MQMITVPEGSPLRAAFIMDGDYMQPYLRAGQLVTVSFRLPAIGECGVFFCQNRALVRQYCEDCFQNAYLLVCDRGQRGLDVTVPAGEKLLCLGCLELPKVPPLPLL